MKKGYTGLEFEKYLRDMLKQSYHGKGKGYHYRIVIKQGKRRGWKNMHLVYYKTKDDKRAEYSPDNVFWITIRILQRMKSFWRMHKGNCTVIIKPIEFKKTKVYKTG